ncbi:hypothetical protein L8N14_017230, partial [Serratia marcescens]|nr:hypothetical protein [Serratia marcescens]
MLRLVELLRSSPSPEGPLFDASGDEGFIDRLIDRLGWRSGNFVGLKLAPSVLLEVSVGGCHSVLLQMLEGSEEVAVEVMFGTLARTRH